MQDTNRERELERLLEDALHALHQAHGLHVTDRKDAYRDAIRGGDLALANRVSWDLDQSDLTGRIKAALENGRSTLSS